MTYDKRTYTHSYFVSEIAFDDRTSSARELWRQMSGNRFKTANPKLLVKTDIVATVDPPHVKVEFVDGTVVRVLVCYKMLLGNSHCFDYFHANIIFIPISIGNYRKNLKARSIWLVK